MDVTYHINPTNLDNVKREKWRRLTKTLFPNGE